MADVAVQFTANFPPYFAGEVATFPEAEAARLVARGLAAAPDAPEPAATPVAKSAAATGGA